MIDTHTHIYLSEFDADRAEVVERAKSVGVKHLVLPNVDVDTLEPLLAMQAQYADYCTIALGLHPTSVGDDFRTHLSTIHEALCRHRVCAVGEVGIDLYWDKTHLREQQEALALQVAWALEHDLPLIIHSRSAFEECYDVLGAAKCERLRGVFHCFDGTLEQAERAIALGFSIGVGGVVTFKKSQLAEFLSYLPLTSILLETDAPYLSPHPLRGKRNEPSNLQYIVAKIAELYAVEPTQVVEITHRNAQKLFALP